MHEKTKGEKSQSEKENCYEKWYSWDIYNISMT